MSKFRGVFSWTADNEIVRQGAQTVEVNITTTFGTPVHIYLPDVTTTTPAIGIGHSITFIDPSNNIADHKVYPNTADTGFKINGFNAYEMTESGYPIIFRYEGNKQWIAIKGAPQGNWPSGGSGVTGPTGPTGPTGSTGSTGPTGIFISTGTASINFGYSTGGEDSFTTVSVLDSNVQSNSIIKISFDVSTNHESIEDHLLEGIITETYDILPGTGFSIYAHAINNTWGSYNIKYAIINA